MSDFPDLSPDTLPDSSGTKGGASTPTPTLTGATLMYCTLPLQLSENQQGAGALTRLDWKQFQTAPQLRLVLQDANGLPINLTDAASVKLRLSRLIGGSLLIAKSMTVAYPAGGIVAYSFVASDVEIAGTFALEVEVVMNNNDVLYFPTWGNVLFVINKSLGGP